MTAITLKAFCEASHAAEQARCASHPPVAWRAMPHIEYGSQSQTWPGHVRGPTPAGRTVTAARCGWRPACPPKLFGVAYLTLGNAPVPARLLVVYAVQGEVLHRCKARFVGAGLKQVRPCQRPVQPHRRIAAKTQEKHPIWAARHHVDGVDLQQLHALDAAAKRWRRGGPGGRREQALRGKLEVSCLLKRQLGRRLSSLLQGAAHGPVTQPADGPSIPLWSHPAPRYCHWRAAPAHPWPAPCPAPHPTDRSC